METKNIIIEKSLDFGVQIVKFCELLEAGRKYVVAKQLLRSGTSIGANVFEAQHPESNADFIHKMKLAIKEDHAGDSGTDTCRRRWFRGL